MLFKIIDNFVNFFILLIDYEKSMIFSIKLSSKNTENSFIHSWSNLYKSFKLLLFKKTVNFSKFLIDDKLLNNLSQEIIWLLSKEIKISLNLSFLLLIKLGIDLNYN